jgi:hypothetical protein
MNTVVSPIAAGKLAAFKEGGPRNRWGLREKP